jgi:hypothetical protein
VADQVLSPVIAQGLVITFIGMIFLILAMVFRKREFEYIP